MTGLVEQILVFVIVELARRQDLAGQGGAGAIAAQNGAFEFAARDTALDDDLAVVAARRFRERARSSSRFCAF